MRISYKVFREFVHGFTLGLAQIGAFAAENIRLIVVLFGFGLLFRGLASWSVALACVCAGVLLIYVGLHPYMKPKEPRA